MSKTYIIVRQRVKNGNIKQSTPSQDVINRKVSSERLRRYLSGESDDSVRLFFSKLQRERGGIGEYLLIFFDVGKLSIDGVYLSMRVGDCELYIFSELSKHLDSATTFGPGLVWTSFSEDNRLRYLNIVCLPDAIELALIEFFRHEGFVLTKGQSHALYSVLTSRNEMRSGDFRKAAYEKFISRNVIQSL